MKKDTLDGFPGGWLNVGFPLASVQYSSSHSIGSGRSILSCTVSHTQLRALKLRTLRHVCWLVFQW